jgi:hypothetical protein
MRKNTIINYREAILRMYSKPSFNAKEWTKTHKIGAAIIPAMRELGMIQKVSDKEYKWTLYRAPDEEDVKMILLRIKARDVQQRKKNSTQLTIKPIRKAPVDTPQPIVKEAECDNSNSKMLLILAVGAIVGFMIATIIWK